MDEDDHEDFDENQPRSDPPLEVNDDPPIGEEEQDRSNHLDHPTVEPQQPPATGNFPINPNPDPNQNNGVNATDNHYNKDNYQKRFFLNNTISSLPLQMFIYFHGHYAVLFFVLNLCLYTYKAIKFYYPGRFLGWELTTVFLYLLINQSRLFMASKGNKTGVVSPFGFSLLLAIPTLILHVYYISLQTYVLRVDLVINAIALIFLGLESVISGMSMLNLYLISRRI